MSNPKLMGAWTQQFAMVPRIIAKDPNLTLQEKGMYLLCMAYAGPDKETSSLSMYAGVAKLAEVSNRSESYISKQLSALIKHKLIWRHRRIGTSSMTYFVDPSERYSQSELVKYELSDSINMQWSTGQSSSIVTGKNSQYKEDTVEEDIAEEGLDPRVHVPTFIDGIFDLWNEAAKVNGCTSHRKTTQKIRRKVQARFKDPEWHPDKWPQIKALWEKMTPFWCGKEDWSGADLMFFVKDDYQIQRLIKGDMTTDRKQKNGAPPPKPRMTEEEAKAVAAKEAERVAKLREEKRLVQEESRRNAEEYKKRQEEEKRRESDSEGEEECLLF